MYAHILVPVDASPRSMKAAGAAIELARKFKARLTALHVVPPYSPRTARGIHPRPTTVPSAAEYRDATQAKAQALLDKVAAAARAAKVACETRIVVDEDAGDAIAGMRADLVVMASSNRRGFERLMLGSVTSDVLEKGRAPVLVCR